MFEESLIGSLSLEGDLFCLVLSKCCIKGLKIVRGDAMTFSMQA